MYSAFLRVSAAIQVTLYWENLQYHSSSRKVIDRFQYKERELFI